MQLRAVITSLPLARPLFYFKHRALYGDNNKGLDFNQVKPLNCTVKRGERMNIFAEHADILSRNDSNPNHEKIILKT